MCPTLFIDALNGKYNDESRWISREDFFRLKDTDPYVAVVWSFGNNLRDYLYSREIEPLKKAIHYAMFFSDYSLGKELGHDLSFIDPIQDLQKRYLAVKHYFSKLGHFQQQSFEGGAESADAAGILQPHDPTCLNANRGGGIQRMQSAEANERLNTFRNIIPWKGCQTQSFKKKNTSDPASYSTTKDETQLHRLQYRERQHTLPRYSGGAKTCPSRPLCLTTKRSAYLKTA